MQKIKNLTTYHECKDLQVCVSSEGAHLELHEMLLQSRLFQISLTPENQRMSLQSTSCFDLVRHAEKSGASAAAARSFSFSCLPLTQEHNDSMESNRLAREGKAVMQRNIINIEIAY